MLASLKKFGNWIVNAISRRVAACCCGLTHKTASRPKTAPKAAVKKKPLSKNNIRI